MSGSSAQKPFIDNNQNYDCPSLPLKSWLHAGIRRNYIQVLCNGGLATVSAPLYVWFGGAGERQLHWPPQDTFDLSALAVLVSLASVCGDTWASEIGSAVQYGEPRLITSWKKVPAGTNGGITVIGTLSSAAGGFMVGLSFWFSHLLLSDQQMPSFIWLGTAAGTIGSVIDSLLGALFQYSGYCPEKKKVVKQPHSSNVVHISGLNILSNDAVNLLSCLMTTLLLVGVLAI